VCVNASRLNVHLSVSQKISLSVRPTGGMQAELFCRCCLPCLCQCLCLRRRLSVRIHPSFHSFCSVRSTGRSRPSGSCACVRATTLPPGLCLRWIENAKRLLVASVRQSPDRSIDRKCRKKKKEGGLVKQTNKQTNVRPFTRHTARRSKWKGSRIDPRVRSANASTAMIRYDSDRPSWRRFFSFSVPFRSHSLCEFQRQCVRVAEGL